MQMPSKNEPHIMGFRLPYLSRKNVGNSDPIGNIRLMTPPRRSDKLRERPTFCSNTDVM